MTHGAFQMISINKNTHGFQPKHQLTSSISQKNYRYKKIFQEPENNHYLDKKESRTL